MSREKHAAEPEDGAGRVVAPGAPSAVFTPPFFPARGSRAAASPHRTGADGNSDD